MTPRLIILITLFLLALAPAPDKSAKSNLPKLKGHPIQVSYLFGIKNKISKKLKITHQSLGIQHFMTPSGLHLTIFTGLLFYFFKQTLFRFIFLIILGFISLKFDHIDSFQRMILFAALRHNPWIKLSTQRSFICTFFVLSFQYFTNPMSYCLSLLFLGLILCQTPMLIKSSYIILAQFLISFWFNQNFYFLGSLYGIFLTASSFIAFPIFLIEYLFHGQWFTQAWESLLYFLFKFKGPQVLLPFSCLAPFFLTKNKSLSKVALTLGLLLFTAPLYSPRISAYKAQAPKGYSSMIRIKNGVKLMYENGMRCFSRIKSDQWISHCYK